MGIPKGLTREHILHALASLDAGEVCEFGESTRYDLVYNGKKYPPKAVVGIAVKLATAEELSPADFSGGKGGGQASTRLTKLGFMIVEKESAQAFKAHRNPPWQRDELILALDLYVRHAGKFLEPSHPEIIKLSDLLNRLPIHANRDATTFRNPAGVSKKLLNFRRFDPAQESEGLKRGNKLEEEVWNAYAQNPGVLRQLAEGIEKGCTAIDFASLEDDEESSFPEGKVLYRLHRMRERNRKITSKAKDRAKATCGRLHCQVCGFDFEAMYGKLGEDYIEGHHTKPVSELQESEHTLIADIALLCSNCHRMIHRKRPWPTVQQLKGILKK